MCREQSLGLCNRLGTSKDFPRKLYLSSKLKIVGDSRRKSCRDFPGQAVWCGRVLSVVSNTSWVTLLSCLRSLEVGGSKWPQFWVGLLKILWVFRALPQGD